MLYQTSSVMLVFHYFTIVLVGSDIKLKALAEFQERVIIKFYTLPKDNNLYTKRCLFDTQRTTYYSNHNDSIETNSVVFFIAGSKAFEYFH